MGSSFPDELPIRKPGFYKTLYWAPLLITEQPITPHMVVQEGSVLFADSVGHELAQAQQEWLTAQVCGGGRGGPHSHAGTWLGQGEGWS